MAGHNRIQYISEGVNPGNSGYSGCDPREGKDE